MLTVSFRLISINRISNENIIVFIGCIEKETVLFSMKSKINKYLALQFRSMGMIIWAPETNKYQL